MPATRPYHHGDLRAALLKSAERTLLEKGVAALSLRELARDIGVSHAAPSRHFRDKQALLDALALAGYERMGQTLEAADRPDLPFDQRFTALAGTYLRFAVDNPELLELMFARKHDPDVSEQLLAAVDRSLGAYERLIAEAQERGEIVAGDPQRIALFAAAGLHGLASFAANGTLPPDLALAALGEHVHHVLYGLKPR